jgi:uncharacterized protein YjbJ (UPF0337 family)
MMDEAKGTVKDVVGKAQDAFGAAAGDASAQIQGKARQVAGKMQKSYGEAVDGMRDTAANNPITVLTIALGIGLFLGMMWSRRD